MYQHIIRNQFKLLNQDYKMSMVDSNYKMKQSTLKTLFSHWSCFWSPWCETSWFGLQIQIEIVLFVGV
jgi:hypothetical protein